MSTFSSETLLKALLATTSSSTINGVFERFLEKQINISPGIRSSASISHNHLRDFLRGENGRDSNFPVILEKNDRDFLSGSFARHTKTWPLDDIDILFPLDGVQLQYTRGGFVTNDTVTSDGDISFNPLLTSRWMNGNNISSNLLIFGFAKVLSRKYPASEVAKDGEAIKVQLTIGSSEDNDGLKFDVVPCFRLQPRDGSAAFYLIPDGHDGWKHTNPRYDESRCAHLQTFHGGHYRKIVKLIKYWNTNTMGGALGSYYIELALANSFDAMTQPIGSISKGLRSGFAALYNAVQQGNIPSPINYAPAVELNTLTSNNQYKLNVAVISSSNATDHEDGGRSDAAISEWKSVFGSQFD